jgi:hypothetical protein
VTVLDSMHQPAGPLAAVEMFGHPFHGLVKEGGSSGLLSLPNGDVIDYRLPQSADAWAYKLAGVPAVERSTEEAAADLENGFQWADKVVLSGQGQQMYGKRLTTNNVVLFDYVIAWLWKNPAGRTFRVSVRASEVLSPMVIDVQPFGEIGVDTVAPVTHSLTLEPGAATFPFHLFDIADAGGRVLIGARDRDNPFVTGERLRYQYFQRLSLAVEVTLSEDEYGWPVPSVSVLKSHDECLGSFESGSTSSGEAPLFLTYDERDVTGDYSGPAVWITVPAGSLPPGVLASAVGRIGRERSDAWASCVDQVMSMYYDDGVPKYVTVSASFTVTLIRDNYHESGSDFIHVHYRDEKSESGIYTYAMGGNVIHSDSWTRLDFLYRNIVGSVPHPPDSDPSIGSLFDSALAARPPWSSPPALYSEQFALYTPRRFGVLFLAKALVVSYSQDMTTDTFTFGAVHWPGGSAAGPPPVTLTGPAELQVFCARDPLTGALSPFSADPVCFV